MTWSKPDEEVTDLCKKVRNFWRHFRCKSEKVLKVLLSFSRLDCAYTSLVLYFYYASGSL